MRKGQISFYLSWVVMAIVMILIATVVIPFGTLMTVEMYKGGEMVWNLTEPSISGIQDDDMRLSVTTAVQTSKDATDTNVNMLTDIWKYSWVIMLIVLALVAFLFTRRSVEFGGGVI